MRQMVGLLPLVLLLAACAGETAVSTTAPVEPPSIVTTSSSTTVVESTTTTEPEGPVNICPRGVVWEPGRVYSVPCFVVPISFEPVDEGWRSISATVASIQGLWVEDDSGEATARFEVWVYQGQGDLESAIELLEQIDGVSVTSGPLERRDAVAAVIVADVETDPVDDVVDQSGKAVDCAEPSRSFGGPLLYWPGYQVPEVDREGSDRTLGLGACRAFRLWGVDAQGVTLILVWSADDPSRFGELVGIADRLFGSISFEAP